VTHERRLFILLVVVVIGGIATRKPGPIPLEQRAAFPGTLPKVSGVYRHGDGTDEARTGIVILGRPVAPGSGEPPTLFFGSVPAEMSGAHGRPALHLTSAREGNREVIFPDVPFTGAEWRGVHRSADGKQILAVLWHEGTWNSAPHESFWVLGSEDSGFTWSIFATLARPYGNAESFVDFEMDGATGTIVTQLDRSLTQPYGDPHRWLRRHIFREPSGVRLVPAVEHTWRTRDGGRTWSGPTTAPLDADVIR